MKRPAPMPAPTHSTAPAGRKGATSTQALLVFDEGAGDPVEVALCCPIEPPANGGVEAAGRVGLYGVPVAKERKTSIRMSVSGAVEENEGLHSRSLWKQSPDFSNVYR